MAWPGIAEAKRQEGNYGRSDGYGGADRRS
jgi:hypothetical protein